MQETVTQGAAELWTIREVGRYLRCGREIVQQLIDKGEIKGRQLSPRRTVVLADSVRAYLGMGQ